MDYLGFINGDNIFKYSFTLGLAMLVFALTYPLEKKNLIELEINSHNKETQLLNNEISNLSTDILRIEKERDYLLIQADVIKQGKAIDQDDTKKRVTQFNKDFNTLQDRHKTLETKKIILDYNKKRILVLESQSNTFGWFSWIMILVGIGLTAFGFYYWSVNTFGDMREKKNKK
jgi:hypothetical protein